MRPSIAFVAASLDILGGQGIQARALAESLRAEGYPETFVAINPRFPAPIAWMRRVPYLRTIVNELLYLVTLPKLRHADVVHVFSASYWSFLLGPAPAILASKMLRKPVVLNYHSGEAADHLSRWRSAAPFLSLADEIVVPSPYLQKIFALHGYATRVIPNVVDTAQFRYRERVPLRPSLLSVRNLENYYRIENTIAAFAEIKRRFPSATLTIAGYGSQEQSLRKMAQRSDVNDAIRFIGRIDPDALPAIYDAADIFLNSSIVDNQPVSILEAFACGLPVVSTPTGDIEAMLCRGDAGLLVNAEDPIEMADAVSRLLEDPESSARIARRAHEEVQRYTWRCVAEQWSAVYAEVYERAGAVQRDKPHTQSSPSHV